MTIKVFAIHDGKMKMFQLPFFIHTVGAALRLFEDLCNDPKSTVNRHPEDFVLYEIGTYDDNTAEFISNHPLSMVAAATEYAKPAMMTPQIPVFSDNDTGKKLAEAK